MQSESLQYLSFNYPLFDAHACAADGTRIGPCIGQISVARIDDHIVARGMATIDSSPATKKLCAAVATIITREGTLTINPNRRVTIENVVLFFDCAIDMETYRKMNDTLLAMMRHADEAPARHFDEADRWSWDNDE